jgi:hypothetical protein
MPVFDLGPRADRSAVGERKWALPVAPLFGGRRALSGTIGAVSLNQPLPAKLPKTSLVYAVSGLVSQKARLRDWRPKHSPCRIDMVKAPITGGNEREVG